MSVSFEKKCGGGGGGQFMSSMSYIGEKKDVDEKRKIKKSGSQSVYPSKMKITGVPPPKEVGRDLGCIDVYFCKQILFFSIFRDRQSPVSGEKSANIFFFPKTPCLRA